eukprot:scaffold233_cov243-Pinguiococcus_pyrenoidosus.AAC.5
MGPSETTTYRAKTAPAGAVQCSAVTECSKPSAFGAGNTVCFPDLDASGKSRTAGPGSSSTNEPRDCLAGLPPDCSWTAAGPA